MGTDLVVGVIVGVADGAKVGATAEGEDLAGQRRGFLVFWVGVAQIDQQTRTFV